MLYLSRLALNPRHPQVRAELHNPYEMHRTLSKGFGDSPGVWDETRCLFRVEESPFLYILVQSRRYPAWEPLCAQDGYLAAAPMVKEFAPAPAADQRLAFRLRANPTVRRAGRRLGLYSEDDQLRWLSRKAASSGFVVCSAVTSGADRVSCRTANGQTAVFSGVTFDGILRVTDPAALQSVVADGVGAGKGLGFGLLSLARCP